jgi:putative membrane protein
MRPDPATANYCRRARAAGQQDAPEQAVKRNAANRWAAGPWVAGLGVCVMAASGAAMAVSLATTRPIQPGPQAAASSPGPIAIESQAIEVWSAGSAALVPMMAADAVATTVSNPDSPADATAGAVGKPVDDLAFVRQASASAQREISAARDALPKLRSPELRQLAQMLVDEHSESRARLSRIAASKGWPLSAPPRAAPASPGTASSSFDARWTADMIAGHERSVALYRAQAQNGEDKELRQFASDTLPTIEHHLERLRSLQQ